MKILILTGKFGMGHYSASQSLRLQLLGAFPGSQVEVVDLPAYAIPDAENDDENDDGRGIHQRVNSRPKP